MKSLLFAVMALVVFVSSPSQAGLDLENQTKIYVPALDLDNDGRILRTEVAEYMFFFLDRDGNESLTKGEYHRERPITVLPYEAEGVSFIDIDNDKQHDEVVYDTAGFLQAIYVDEYDTDDGAIKAYDMMDIVFGRIDTDKSRAVELDEWQKHFQKFANKKPDQAPKAANNDYYGQ